MPGALRHDDQHPGPELMRLRLVVDNDVQPGLPSTTCTSSSPFGCLSQAPLPENFAAKMLPSRNGVSVAKAPLSRRSASSMSGRRSRSIASFPVSPVTSIIVTIGLSTIGPFGIGPFGIAAR